LPASARARDGSSFPFDHLPGIIRVWTGRGRGEPSAAPDSAAGTACVMASLPDLWPRWTLHRSVSTYSPTKVIPVDDQS
jgi:hypothetical protein